MKLARGSAFLGCTVVACAAWLIFYARSSLPAPDPGTDALRQPEASEAVPLSAQELQRFLGDYELGADLFTISSRDGRLFVNAPDHSVPEMEILAASATHLFLRNGQGDLTVIHDRQGQVTGLRINQGDSSRLVRKVR